MVFTSNVKCTSLYRNHDGVILVGESPQCYQIPTKSYDVTEATTSEPHITLEGSFNHSTQIRTFGEEEVFSGDEIRSRVNTFSESIPSTSSEFNRTPNSEANNSPPLSSEAYVQKHVKTTSSSSSTASKSLEINERNEEYFSEKDDVDEEMEDEELDEDQLAEVAVAEGASGSSLVEKRHKCDICGKAFPYMSILESHKRCHTGEKPFSCHFCDKKFAQKATLQVHERTHTGERPYKCKYCEKTFAQYGTKTVHEKSAHLGIRNYKCPKCNKFLSSPSALYTHKKTHGDKSFQCAFCPKQFTLKNYLKLHIKQVHEHGERKHVCKFCSKTFAYAGSLQVHVRTHTGERPYICKFCPKAFASQGNLQSHERTHTGERPYICRHCGRSFIQKSQLTAHEATHTYGDCMSDKTDSLHDDELGEFRSESDGYLPEQNNNNINYVDMHQGVVNNSAHVESQLEMFGSSDIGDVPSDVEPNSISPDSISQSSGKDRRQSDFVCKFCGKRYAYASSLYVHTRLHTGERPFRCNFCDKSFTNQGNMQVHLRVHTGEKPYKCDACGKCYAQKVGLKIHQEQCQVHLNRRGSVVTIDSESSPPSTGSIDSAETAMSESERAFVERLLFEEKQYIATLNANQCGQSTRFGQPDNLKNISDATVLPQAAAIAQLLELRSEIGVRAINQSQLAVQSDLPQRVTDSVYKVDTNINTINQAAHLSTPMLPISNSTISPSNLPSLNYLSTPITTNSSVSMNPLLNVPTTVPLLTCTTGNNISSAIDILMRQQTQSNIVQQQKPLADLLMEFEQRQLLQQQQQLQQHISLQNFLEIPSSTSTASSLGLSLSDVVKLIQPQPPIVYNQHSASSQSIYTQLQPLPEVLQLQQQQSQQCDTQRIFEQILQLRAIEQQQQQQQQHSILASIQQVLPSLLNGNSANDCNNNNATVIDSNNNNNGNPLINALSVGNSMAATRGGQSPSAPYVQPIFTNGSRLSTDSAYAVPKESNLASTYPLNSDALSNDKRSLVIVAAEALQSLSKQQCILPSPTPTS